MTNKEAMEILTSIKNTPAIKWENGADIAFDLAIKALEERPQGEWIDEDDSYYANCSNCGYQINTHHERGYLKFCPNCGADMRGKENE